MTTTLFVVTIKSSNKSITKCGEVKCLCNSSKYEIYTFFNAIVSSSTELNLDNTISILTYCTLHTENIFAKKMTMRLD